MKLSKFAFLVLLTTLVIATQFQTTHAAVVATGDVDPSNPTTWGSNAFRVYIGKTGNGYLDISNGGVVSASHGFIGYESGSTGEVTINGAGSIWNTGWFYVGHTGSGVLNITDGGAMSCFGSSHLGEYPGSTGVATVDGVGSTWETHWTHLGCDGSGTLNVINGGTVTSAQVQLGTRSGSSGQITVDGTGSTWTGGPFFIGIKGSGKLNIMNGGEINSSRAYIGYGDGLNGVVTVHGNGSKFTLSSNLYVGTNLDGSPAPSNRGTLKITDCGFVSVAGTLVMDDGEFLKMSSGGMLALNGNASSLNNFLDLIDDEGEIRYWDDSISDWADITGAIYGRDYTLSYLTEGDLAGYTMLTVDNFATEVSIDIKPGSDPNSINLGSNGNIPVVIFSTDDFDASTIDPATIMLADAGVKEHGQNGDLKFSFKDVNSDGLDDLFIHIDTEGLVLSNDDVEAQLTAETFDGLSIFGTDAIRLVGSSRGDFDMDGKVDVSDLGELAAHYGNNHGKRWHNGDADGDGIVDVSDLGILASHYGETALVASVPEPSTLFGLLALCLAGTLASTRRKSYRAPLRVSQKFRAGNLLHDGKRILGLSKRGSPHNMPKNKLFSEKY
ncbi:MAG: PEP-CTERM sorting domain-containing protein [Pirellulales bacterium]|nr:PEP-CTERM sorting domain-containing protein [Pirellulales bacterium]